MYTYIYTCVYAYIYINIHMYTYEYILIYVWHDFVWVYRSKQTYPHDCNYYHPWHDAFICVRWRIHIFARLIYMCGMTHSYVRHDSFIYVWHNSSIWVYLLEQAYPHDRAYYYPWHDAFISVTCRVEFICVTWHIHIFVAWLIYAWYDSFICVTWLMNMSVPIEASPHDCNYYNPWHCWYVLQCVAVCCSVLQCVAVCCSVLQCVAVCCSAAHTIATTIIHDTTHSYVWDYAFSCYDLSVWNMTHLYVWHDAFIYVTWLIRMSVPIEASIPTWSWLLSSMTKPYCIR